MVPTDPSYASKDVTVVSHAPFKAVLTLLGVAKLLHDHCQDVTVTAPTLPQQSLGFYDVL